MHKIIRISKIPGACVFQLVGWPGLVGIVLALSGSPSESWIMDHVGDHEERLKTAQDVRTSLVSEYICSIQIIKYYGWEESATKKIAQARATEQMHVRAIGIFSTGLALFANFFPIPSLVSILGLHVFVRKVPLTASTAYTTIQLLEIVKDCLAFLALVSVDFSRAMVSLRRLDSAAAGTTFHLRAVVIQFSQGGLNVVTGDSGSGKSTLLLALLAETVQKSGSVTRQQDVADAPQTAWLQAGTIRDSILFYREYDKKRYREIFDACCLDVDLAAVQHGDQTVIGNGGFALSGGQRARVALARALFSDASLLLLDDIFSALDSKTSMELWNGVFCSGVLQNRTVILVTQHTWTTHEANVAFVLNSGRVQSTTENLEHVRKARAIPSKENAKEECSSQICTRLSTKTQANDEKQTRLVADQEKNFPGQEGHILRHGDA